MTDVEYLETLAQAVSEYCEIPYESIQEQPGGYVVVWEYRIGQHRSVHTLHVCAEVVDRRVPVDTLAPKAGKCLCDFLDEVRNVLKNRYGG